MNADHVWCTCLFIMLPPITAITLLVTANQQLNIHWLPSTAKPAAEALPLIAVARCHVMQTSCAQGAECLGRGRTWSQNTVVSNQAATDGLLCCCHRMLTTSLSRGKVRESWRVLFDVALVRGSADGIAHTGCY